MNLLITRSDVVERRARSSIECRRSLRAALCVILFATAFLTSNVGAQVVPGKSPEATSGRGSNENKARTLGRQQALQSIRKGDLAAATGLLRQNLDRKPGASPEDVQLGGELAMLAFQLQENNERGLASQVAGAAFSALDRGRGQATSKEAGSTRMIAGQLSEIVLQDRKQAIALYEAALALDPTLRRASQRIQQLRAVEEAPRSRAAANEVLRQRAAQPKR